MLYDLTTQQAQTLLNLNFFLFSYRYNNWVKVKNNLNHM
jgi:hypothetical protein